MSWARIDDGYSLHPKIVEAGVMAELLDMRAIIYCARMETDGFVGERTVKLLLGREIPNPMARARRLVEVGRWEVREGGFLVHGFLEFNPSKAEKESERAANSARQDVYRTRGLADAIKARDGNMCRYCASEVSWKDRRGPNGAVFEHVHPVVQGGETILGNLVVACRSCNAKKAGRTPEQAGMVLREPSLNLDKRSRYTGSGGESLSLNQEKQRVKPLKFCKTCDSLDFDCNCPRVVSA